LKKSTTYEDLKSQITQSLLANFEQQILFERDAPSLIDQIERVFTLEGTSDHGMLDYILDMWQ